MRVQVHDLLHGAALTQIVEHPRFKSLNKASKEYGHYLINDDRRVWIKYLSKNGAAWRFGFSSDEVLRIQVDEDDHPIAGVFVALVCGEQTVCLLTNEELWSLVDRDGPTDVQVVKVVAPSGKSMRLSGPLGDLDWTIPHNRFPDLVVE